MSDVRKDKKEIDKISLILSIIAILSIAAIGTFLLKMQNIDESRIIQPNFDGVYEEQIQSQSEVININTASKEELMLLEGIGESKAESIVSYREKHLFETTRDIMKVSGIGEMIYENIADKICVQ